MLVDQRQVGLEDAGAVRTLLGGRVGLAELRRVGRVRVASQVALALEQRAEVVEDEGGHSAPRLLKTRARRCRCAQGAESSGRRVAAGVDPPLPHVLQGPS